MRTFVVELGTGVDLHGQDATKAAVRAVRTAFQHVSLPGLRQVAGVEDISTVIVDVVIGAPPEAGEVDAEQVKTQFPIGTVSVTVQPGGLMPVGEAFRPEFGDTATQCASVHAGAYVQADGVKLNEQRYEIDSLTVHTR
jgi:uncharacterized protein (TIGR02058 family)